MTTKLLVLVALAACNDGDVVAGHAAHRTCEPPGTYTRLRATSARGPRWSGDDIQDFDVHDGQIAAIDAHSTLVVLDRWGRLSMGLIPGRSSEVAVDASWIYLVVDDNDLAVYERKGHGFAHVSTFRIGPPDTGSVHQLHATACGLVIVRDEGERWELALDYADLVDKSTHHAACAYASQLGGCGWK